MNSDIFLLKLEQELPKYPYYISDWRKLQYDDYGAMLKTDDIRYVSPNLEIELHYNKKESTEYYLNLDNAWLIDDTREFSKNIKIDNEYFNFYNIKNKSKYSEKNSATILHNWFHSIPIYYNYFRKDGPARIEKIYKHRDKSTTYYCRWYSNVKGLQNRVNGPANYRLKIDSNNSIDVITYEWLKGHGLRHRIGAPATYSFNKYNWFYEGHKESSFNYWKIMLEKYPIRYKNICEDDSKIIIKSKSPSPSILYKGNKSVIWKLNNKSVSLKKYWDFQELKKQHLLIVE
jgi:hypothetical protein